MPTSHLMKCASPAGTGPCGLALPGLVKDVPWVQDILKEPFLWNLQVGSHIQICHVELKC